MGIKDFLREGKEVLGSELDGKVKNLSDFDNTTAKRLGYMDEEDFWTDKGYQRATSVDYDRLQEANETIQKLRDEQNKK